MSEVVESPADLADTWYGKVEQLRTSYPSEPIAIFVQRVEPNGRFEVGKYDADAFNPATLPIPPGSQGRLFLRFRVGNQFQGSMHISVTPPASRALPVAGFAPRPPAAAGEESALIAMLREQMEFQRSQLEALEKRAGLVPAAPAPAAGSDFQRFAEMAKQVREIVSVVEPPSVVDRLIEVAAPMALAFLQRVAAQAPASAPAARSPGAPAAPAAPVVPAAPAESGPRMIETPAGVVQVTPELEGLADLLRLSVLRLGLDADGVAAMIAQAFDVKTTDDGGPWDLLEVLPGDGSIASVLSALAPDLGDRSELFAGVESRLREMHAEDDPDGADVPPAGVVSQVRPAPAAAVEVKA